MFDGLDNVGNAVRILVSSNKPVYGRLSDAMLEFFVGSTAKAEWPERIHPRVEKLERDYRQAETDGTLASAAPNLALDLLNIHEYLQLAMSERGQKS